MRNKKKSKTLKKSGPIYKLKPLEHVEKGDVVLCKMRGCPWPAFVTGFDNNLIVIEFFGDHTTHKAAISNFYEFKEAHELIIANLRTRKSALYSKAVKEAEIMLGIPVQNSILNQIF